jgi:23S rRNA (uridine2552-2'-O)-methyltransferase
MPMKKYVARGRRTRLLKKKGRRPSSTRWLERQFRDPYVAQAKARGYRSRAAFKLIELDDKFHFLSRGARVADLGAAPGGWSQVAAERVGREGKIVAADILKMEPLPNTEILQIDLFARDAVSRLETALGGAADVVLSDMAAPTTGHRDTDHLRTLALFESAFDIAGRLLRPGGTFVGKFFQGGVSGELFARLKQRFKAVKHVKPPASRKESVEVYVVARGFRPA